MRIKTDLYTRIVLTVIAVVLTLHLVKDINFVGEANAAPLPFATQTDGVIDVNIVQVDGKKLGGKSIPVSSPGYLDVTVSNWPYSINVSGSVTCN